MKFSVIGGDRRSALLCSLLCEDGHRVQSFALEQAKLSSAAPGAGCLQAAVYGADCVVLPCPAEQGGWIRTPLSDYALKTEEVLAALWPGQLLCGGKFSDETGSLAARAGLLVEDLMRRADFTAENAAITAEGAIGILMEQGERTVKGARVLICGWGRVGKLAAIRLAALGADVCVVARRAEDRAIAQALGLDSLRYEQMEGEIGGFDWVINTVPARILADSALCLMAEDTLLLELASPPGGFDRQLAENIGLKVIAAPGLPGTYAPMSAAMLLRDTLYQIIKEQEG